MTAPATHHAELDAGAREALASAYAFLLELAKKKAEATGRVASAEGARRGCVDAEPRTV